MLNIIKNTCSLFLFVSASFATTPCNRYEYNSAGDIVRQYVCDANSNIIADSRMDYDDLGRVWRERILETPDSNNDANDRITLYEFDPYGNLLKTVRKGYGCENPDTNEPNDIITSNRYDTLSRPVQQIDGEGNITSFTYDKDNHLLTKTDPNGFAAGDEYDDAGRLAKSTDAEGGYRLFYYNSLGQTINTIVYDCNGSPLTTNDDFAVKQERYEYTNFGKPARKVVMKNPASTSAINTAIDMVEENVYDSNNGMLYQQKTYYNGSQTAATTYYYDEIERKERIVDPESNEQKFYYENPFCPARLTKQEQINYNSAGSITVTTLFDYDSFGRLYTSTIDRSSGTDITNTYYYDALGRQASIAAPDGVITAFNYDAFGNLLRKTEDVSGNDRITDYKFDRLGRQISIIGYDPNSQATHYTYNNNDKVTQITYPDGNSISYYYDVCGTVDQEVKLDGSSVYYSYDNLGRVLEESDSLTNPTFVTSFGYDGAGRLLSTSKVTDGVTVSQSAFTYNGFGLKETETTTYDSNSNTAATITYSYDQSGNILLREDSITGAVIEYTYDGLGRIKTIEKNGTQIAEYSYIGTQVKTKEYTQAGIITTNGFDDVGRLEQITAVNSSETILDLIYTYDIVSNRTSAKYNHLATALYDIYDYDNLRRLTSVEYGSSSGISMSDYGTDFELAVKMAQKWLGSPIYSLADGLNLKAKITESHQASPGNSISDKIISTANKGDYVLSLADFGASDTLSSIASSDKKPKPPEDGNSVIKEAEAADALKAMTESRVMNFPKAEIAFAKSGVMAMSSLPPENSTEEFTYDLLGNRTQIKVRDGYFINYNVDRVNNRYLSLATAGRGSGTSADPCVITTIDELQAMQNDLDAYYQLGCDIDASATANWNSGAGFVPVTVFTGQFDGNGHIINGLTINRPSSDTQGLFGNANYATIKNVKVLNASVQANRYSGVLAGNCAYATVENCCASGTVTVTTGSTDAGSGGLLGLAQARSMIRKCASAVNVSASYRRQVGSLMGYLRGRDFTPKSRVENCYTTGTVTGSGSKEGNLIGDADGAEVDRSYSCGYYKALLGYNFAGSVVTNSYWDKTIGAASSYYGGTGKTTTQMKQQATFVNWDFNDIWDITENTTYPWLQDTQFVSTPYYVVKSTPLYDDNGNMTRDHRGVCFGYDYRSRLTSVTDGSSSAQYSYDSLGRRIKKVAAGTTIYYYYDTMGRVIAERIGSAAARSFVYGNGLDEVLSMTNISGSNSTYYYHADALGSVMALSDSSGEVVERYQYNAYGQPYILSADDEQITESSCGNQYLFTGKRVDLVGESMLQDNVNRTYHYDLGRWMQTDPLGVVPNAQGPNAFAATGQYKDGMNLYEYVKSNPVLLNDAIGLDAHVVPDAIDLINSGKKRCGVCGPDITGALSDLNRVIDAAWRAYIKTDEQKKNICNAMFNPVVGWDMSDMLDGSLDTYKCPIGNCGGTVTVSGKCYDASKVNYWLWGKMRGLCKDSLKDATGYVDTWKKWAYSHPIDSDTQAWISAGYSGSISPSGEGNCPKCKPCRLKKYVAASSLNYHIGWRRTIGDYGK